MHSPEQAGNEISMDDINILLQEIGIEGISTEEIQELLNNENPDVYNELVKYLEQKGKLNPQRESPDDERNTSMEMEQIATANF